MALPGDYQEPDEVIAGQPVPAESFNKYGNSIIWLKNKVSDSSTFDDIAPTTTKGDLIVHGESGNERLAVGGGSQFLMSTGEMPQWQVLDPYLNMSAVEQGQLPVAHGGTGADLSETGGTGHVLKQSSEGADVTVGALEASDIPNLDASRITTGALPIARGGTGQTSAAAALSALSPTNTRGDLIVRGATEHERLSIGGSGRFLQSNGTDPSWQLLSASDIPSLDTSKLGSGQLALARGGTGANLSATGGSGQVLKQSSTGAAVTVGALAASDIPSLDTSKLTSGQLVNARGGLPRGTSFPGSPSSGDLFLRTDFAPPRIYYYDGSAWQLMQGRVATRVYGTSNVSLLTNTWTTLDFNTERYDTDSLHSTSSNTSRLTIPSGLGGLYTISGALRFAVASGGLRYMRIQLNGTTVIAQAACSPSPTDVVNFTIATDWMLDAGDYVELQAYQSSGGNLDVQAQAAQSPEFMMHRVG